MDDVLVSLQDATLRFYCWAMEEGELGAEAQKPGCLALSMSVKQLRTLLEHWRAFLTVYGFRLQGLRS